MLNTLEITQFQQQQKKTFKTLKKKETKFQTKYVFFSDLLLAKCLDGYKFLEQQSIEESPFDLLCLPPDCYPTPTSTQLKTQNHPNKAFFIV